MLLFTFYTRTNSASTCMNQLGENFRKAFQFISALSPTCTGEFLSRNFSNQCAGYTKDTPEAIPVRICT